MKKVVHRADTRGYFDHGWLKTYHTFSFADYHDPARIRFGLLRVLNDDTVEAGYGFGMHPHQDMEIVSIPLEGGLEHSDSMGHKGVIRPGQIQVMSAGTGVYHSEYNASKTEPVKFLQIWVFTQEEGLKPRYSDVTLLPETKNELQQIVGPLSEAAEHIGWVHQDAWFYLATLDEGQNVSHETHNPRNGVYLFVLEGTVKAGGEMLGPRDGMGIWESEKIEVASEGPSRILLIEVPMSL